jgi:DDE superfamily endonuclease
MQDYGLFKKLFSPTQPWLAEKIIRVDLGFLGIATDYACLKVHIPHKKSKLHPLTEEQKADNQVLASKRIPVEHSFAGLKRYRILSDRVRIHDWDLYDTVLGVCAGLWNFYITH